MLNLYKVIRSVEEEWMGAMLIAAKDENEAASLYRKADDFYDFELIKLIPDVFVAGESRVIYNDEAR